MHGPYYYDGVGWIWGLFMFLFWAALFGLAVWAILRLTRPHAPLGPRPGPETRGAVPPPPPPIHHATPREILDRRYVTGEIDVDTYEEMRARLEGPRPEDPPPTAST